METIIWVLTFVFALVLISGVHYQQSCAFADYLLMKNHPRIAEHISRTFLWLAKYFPSPLYASLPRGLAPDIQLREQLSRSLDEQFRYEAAAALDSETIQILEDARDYESAGRLACTIAGRALKIGDLERADEMSRTALKVLRIDENTPDDRIEEFRRLRRFVYCHALFVRAWLLETVREFDDSEQLWRRALTLMKDDDETAKAPFKSMLGRLLVMKGRGEDALPMLNEALECRMKTLGPNDLQTASVKQHIGKLHLAQGDYVKAEPLLREALRLTVRARGDVPDVYENYFDIGLLELKRGNLHKAEESLAKALSLCERGFGKTHPWLLPVLEAYRDMLIRSNREAEAGDIKARIEELNVRCNSIKSQLQPVF